MYVVLLPVFISVCNANQQRFESFIACFLHLKAVDVMGTVIVRYGLSASLRLNPSLEGGEVSIQSMILAKRGSLGRWYQWGFSRAASCCASVSSCVSCYCSGVCAWWGGWAMCLALCPFRCGLLCICSWPFVGKREWFFSACRLCLM